MVNTKAIRMAISLRLLHGPTPLHLSESVHQVEGCRAKNCDEQASGKGNTRAGTTISLPPSALPVRRAGVAWFAVNLRRRVIALAIEVPNLSVWISIATRLRRSSTPVRSAKIAQAPPHAHVLRGFRDLPIRIHRDVGMHVLQFTADLHHRGIQAETGFNRDDHQVERIRQAPAHQLLSRFESCLPQNVTRQEEADDESEEDIEQSRY